MRAYGTHTLLLILPAIEMAGYYQWSFGTLCTLVTEGQ